MDAETPMTKMSQKIFNSGLSTETISVYLAVCSFIDGGSRPGLEDLVKVWNSGRGTLRAGLDELLEKNILETSGKDIEGGKIGLTDPESWSI